MKKVCILSMQRVSNFGSLLQSYSLKKIIEELGAEVHFIDIERNESDDRAAQKSRITYDNEAEAHGGLLSKFKKLDRYALNRLRIKLRSRKQEKLFEAFRKDILRIAPEDNQKKYDLCVIGSDEVFNCTAPSPWGFTSQLFGNVRQADEVITYAASCGATSPDRLTPQMLTIIENAFQRVQGFSARDENTEAFMKAMTDEKVFRHSDPVLIGDFSDEIEKTEIRKKLPQKFCIIYSYYNRIHDPAEIRAIQSFCRKQNLKPIAIGAPQMWLKSYLPTTPFEMMKIFQMADFIITDTFHGTLFSAKLNGHFAVMCRESNRNKLSDLVKTLHVQNHVVGRFEELDRVYKEFSNKEDFKEFYNNSREQSMNYLKDFLKN